MARYIGPKTKIYRKFGELIYGKTNKKKYPPGQHANSRNIKKTFYSTQLLEKQKSKYTYGILERQFRKMFYKASKKKGIKGEILLQLCESRLDNIVYRLNLSHSRPEARQLVSHRHITVNGKIVNIPSFNLKPGDKISLKHKQLGSLKQKKLGSLKQKKLGSLKPKGSLKQKKLGSLKPKGSLKQKKLGSLKQKKLGSLKPKGSDWLSWDNEKMIGIFKYIPKRKQIPEKINEKLIVELYSK